MERIKAFGSACTEGFRAVRQGRSALTAPYLMAVNTLFWATSLYCDNQIQQRALTALCASIIGSDVLFTATQDRSIAMHIICWPIQSFWRTFGFGLNLKSLFALRAGEIEIAFWTAYGGLTCLLINPVWEYQEVNQKIATSVKQTCTQFYAFLNAAIIQPIFVVGRAIKYIVCFEFIPPLWQAIRKAFSSTGGGIRALWNSCINGLSRCGSAIARWWRDCIIAPIGRFLQRTKKCLTYWFCAHWWPDFKTWLKARFGKPLQRLFNYACYCLVYVFCGHWVPPLYSFVKRHTMRFAHFAYENAIIPMKIWVVDKLRAVGKGLQRLLHQTALAIRDSVIWPMCLWFAAIGKQVYTIVHASCIQPVINYFYVRYKKVEDFMFIYTFGPVCETFLRNIPEKSPFCEDTDEEFDGLLPDEMTDEEEVPEPTKEQTPPPKPLAQRPPELKKALEQSKPKQPAKIVQPKSGFSEDDLLPDDESVLDEDDDLSMGLQFPAVEASESSDDELDLSNHIVMKKRKKREPKPVPRTIEERDLLPIRRKTRQKKVEQPSENPDDDFVTLE